MYTLDTNMYNNQPSTGQTYENVYCNAFYPMMQQQHFAYNASYSGNMYYNVYPSHVTCDNSIFNNMTLNDRIRGREEDEKAIEHFLQDAESQISANETSKKRKDSCKIADVKNALTSVVKLNKQLETVCTELKGDVDDLPEEQWQERVSACNAAKIEICEILKSLKEGNQLDAVKRDLEKRKKKRTRQRLRREKWKKEKSMNEERIARLHAEADSWIRQEQAVIEREKQEEKLRKDADMVLSDVRSKRNDARKYLGILQELQNLQRIKANVARARGENLSSAAEKVFNKTIAKLTEQWTALDREVATEEQELKQMLKQDNEKRVEKQTQTVLHEWENTLFGTNILPIEQSNKDSNSLIMIRTAWDKFISSEINATTIPIGWIVPEKPSSDVWQKCFNKEISSDRS